MILLQTISKESIITLEDDQVPWSACGAFIHGLEDEFEAVRCATIRNIKWFRDIYQSIGSIFTLALCSREFSAKATDYIIDAFNDESDNVRILSVRTLHGICLVHRVLLGTEHLESTLCLLDDVHPDFRSAVRSLLQVAFLKEDEGVVRTIKCLGAASLRHPEDMDDVFFTFAKIGTNNAELVSRVIPSLIKVDRYFMISEPRVEDSTRMHS